MARRDNQDTSSELPPHYQDTLGPRSAELIALRICAEQGMCTYNEQRTSRGIKVNATFHSPEYYKRFWEAIDAARSVQAQGATQVSHDIRTVLR